MHADAIAPAWSGQVSGRALGRRASGAWARPPRFASVHGWKQRGKPTEQTLPRYRFLAVDRGIQHHLDNTLNVPIDWCKRADVHSQPARDGRAHGFVR